MRNHVHIIMRPACTDALACCLRRAHAEYAQWFNRRTSRIGHLWQNRYFSSVLEKGYVLNALRYVDQNPVRAGVVDRADEFRWSSARAHCRERADEFGLMSLEWREWREWPDWDEFLREQEEAEMMDQLRNRTRQGRPLGGAAFTWEVQERLNWPMVYPESASAG